MSFNADGSRLVISDTDDAGWLWVFDTERPIGPDYDCDGDVDLEDYAVLADCLEGPAVPASPPACEGVDLDADGDLDLVDFAILQRCFSGAGVAANAGCDG
jgi:hypothetical protein